MAKYPNQTPEQRAWRRDHVLRCRANGWYLRISDRLNDKCMRWVNARLVANNKRLSAIVREQELLIEFSNLGGCRVATFRKVEALFDKETGGGA